MFCRNKFHCFGLFQRALKQEFSVKLLRERNYNHPKRATTTTDDHRKGNDLHPLPESRFHVPLSILFFVQSSWVTNVRHCSISRLHSYSDMWLKWVGRRILPSG